LIGSVGGTVLGFLGGFVGAYFSIKNTHGPRERAFMIRMSALCFIAVLAFLLALWLIPLLNRIPRWLPYILFLPLAIRALNRRQQQLRREAANDA
jgi:hypothetical protein